MNAMASNEVDLYDTQGNPVVYIAIDDGMTIYSWGGQPDAYLKRGQNNEFDVYGFNGKHLGWFIKGNLSTMMAMRYAGQKRACQCRGFPR